MLQPSIAGASALSYRIEVAGRPYLLRLESFRRDEIRDPHRAYLCLRAAGEAGIAPAVGRLENAAVAEQCANLRLRTAAFFGLGSLR